MKKIMKVLSAILVCAVLTFCVSAFTDIEDADTANAVATLESMGLVSGTSATKYSPSLTLTRAQVCTMMIRAKGLENAAESYVNQKLFTDVKSNAWYSGYVNLAYREGIIAGYGNGKFGPEDKINYGQFVTILLRMLGYSESDIGNVWPADYIVFASDIGLDDNISLKANDDVSRADAAILLYNALLTNAKGAKTEFYQSLGGYAASVEAIILDNDSKDSKDGDLYACTLGASGVEMKYYEQKNRIPDTLVGSIGDLLLNGSGKVIGFLPKGSDREDIIVASAKISGITDTSGNTVKISNSTRVISENNVYTYGTTGYIKVNSHANQPARLYYNDNGDVEYIYLTTGIDFTKAEMAVASLDAPISEFKIKLGINNDGFIIVKNGVQTTADTLAMYDVAYYDNVTNTLRVSDCKVTGYIELASPSVSAASSITVSGAVLNVLESAWQSLGTFKLGDRVTLLLNDMGSVAAALPADALNADMYGVLSADGNSVTLCTSNVTMKPADISADFSLNGSLVKVDTSDSEIVKCTSASKLIFDSDTLNVKENTVGGNRIAPGCAIYEWGTGGYVYSLSGEMGKSSADLGEIHWADSLDSSYVSFYHLNSLGLVDVLLLTNVTGNYYEYGNLKVYKDGEGVLSYKGLTVTNDVYPNESKKYICTVTNSGGYAGVSFGQYSKNYSKVAAVAKLTEHEAAVTDFRLDGDDEWYFTLAGGEIPISENVKVYVKTTDKWFSGEEGILLALSSEMKINVYYDRTTDTGAQVRIIVVG